MNEADRTKDTGQVKGLFYNLILHKELREVVWNAPKLGLGIPGEGKFKEGKIPCEV